MKCQRRNVVGSRVHFFRRKKGITQLEICLKLQEIGLPLSQSALSKIESGERRVRDTELFLLARVLDVSLEELLCDAHLADMDFSE